MPERAIHPLICGMVDILPFKTPRMFLICLSSWNKSSFESGMSWVINIGNKIKSEEPLIALAMQHECQSGLFHTPQTLQNSTLPSSPQIKFWICDCECQRMGPWFNWIDNNGWWVYMNNNNKTFCSVLYWLACLYLATFSPLPCNLNSSLTGVQFYSLREAQVQ